MVTHPSFKEALVVFYDAQASEREQRGLREGRADLRERFLQRSGTSACGSERRFRRRDNRFVNLEYPKPELRSDKVHLRKWSLEDLGCVEAASRDPEIPRGTTIPALYSEAEGQAWIERQWSRQTSGQGLSMAMADPETDESKGLVYLGLRRIEGHCELGYWLIPHARGRGLGTAAIRLVSRWVLRDTGVYRLVAYVEPHNLASCALLRKCGLHKRGSSSVVPPIRRRGVRCPFLFPAR